MFEKVRKQKTAYYALFQETPLPSKHYDCSYPLVTRDDAKLQIGKSRTITIKLLWLGSRTPLPALASWRFSSVPENGSF